MRVELIQKEKLAKGAITLGGLLVMGGIYTLFEIRDETIKDNDMKIKWLQDNVNDIYNRLNRLTYKCGKDQEEPF